ncbi:MAG TPA: CAP domain-containing protein, partial [Oceanipulchritudo sp.]|nr:CAP domain-containing protein [Oceanipulchritudo sp.]
MQHRFTLFLALLAILPVPAVSETSGPDPSIRWHVRQFFNTVYPADPTISMDWTGTYSLGNAGTIAPAWQEETRRRVNFFRSMAGIPGEIEFDQSLSAQAQEAALMMSAAKQLSHTPGPNWPMYTENGARAAQFSNLALGTSGPNGPDAVDGYIIDPGPFNTAVGHRRWILFPYDTPMGNGDVPHDSSGAYSAANALWVIPQSLGSPLETRDPFVAWPPRGFVPAPLVYSRWSFSLPGADFQNASVSMEMDGQRIPLTLEPLETRRIGDPTIVWVPNGMSTNTRAHWPLPQVDETILVTVSDVLLDGTLQSFTYAVSIFDPAVPGNGETPASVTLQGPLAPNLPTTVSVAAPPWAEAVQGRILTTRAGIPSYGAEATDPSLLPSISAGYAPVQSERVAAGTSAYHLVHPEAVSQWLLLPGEYIIGADSPMISFASSLAWATEGQVAHLEMNTGSGDNWSSIWSASGPAEGNSAFTEVSVDLSSWTGRTARFRFHYRHQSGSFFVNTEPSMGWAFDRIRFKGIERVDSTALLPLSVDSSTFDIIPSSSDPFYLQARAYAFGGFPLEWGPASLLLPDAGPTTLRTTIGA